MSAEPAVDVDHDIGAPCEVVVVDCAGGAEGCGHGVGFGLSGRPVEAADLGLGLAVGPDAEERSGGGVGDGDVGLGGDGAGGDGGGAGEGECSGGRLSPGGVVGADLVAGGG